jgi:hypothetical protein
MGPKFSSPHCRKHTLARSWFQLWNAAQSSVQQGLWTLGAETCSFVPIWSGGCCAHEQCHPKTNSVSPKTLPDKPYQVSGPGLQSLLATPLFKCSFWSCCSFFFLLFVLLGIELMPYTCYASAVALELCPKPPAFVSSGFCLVKASDGATQGGAAAALCRILDVASKF